MRVLALLLVLVATTARAERMEPGEWEFVSEIAVPGLPRPQQSGYRACLTREQARDPMLWGRSATVPSDCKVTSVKLGPDYTAWEMDCPASNMRGAGRARISRNDMSSELKLTGGVVTRTRGRRLGPCKP